MVHSFAPVSAVELYVTWCVNTEYKVKIPFLCERAEALIFISKVHTTRTEQLKSWHGDFWHLQP